MAPFPPPPSPHCCRTISSFLSHFPSVQDGLTWCCPCLSFLAAACVMLGNECFLFWWGKDFPSGEGIIFAHDSGRLLLLWQFLLPHSVWLVSLLTLRASFLHLIFELEKCSRQSCSGMFYFQASLNCPQQPWTVGDWQLLRNSNFSQQEAGACATSVFFSEMAWEPLVSLSH